MDLNTDNNRSGVFVTPAIYFLQITLMKIKYIYIGPIYMPISGSRYDMMAMENI